MNKIQFERGKIIETSPEVVAALWNNWEIYDALLNKKFNVRRTGKQSWTAEYHFKVNFELVAKEVGLHGGKFVFIFLVRAIFMSHPIIITLRYVESSENSTSVYGDFAFEWSPLIKIFEPVLRSRVHKVIDAVINGGQISCEMVSKNYKKVTEMLPNEYLKIINEYIEVGKLLRLQFFENDYFECNAQNDTFINMSDKILDYMDEKTKYRLNSLIPKIGHLAGEINRSLEIAKLDLSQAIAKNRSIAEIVAKELFQEEIGKDPKIKMFGEYLGRLEKESKKIPRIIFVHMNNVSQFGNLGIHSGNKMDHLYIRPEDYIQSFSSLLYIIEWYFDQYKPTGM